MTDCRFVAFHGWGFNARNWQPWGDFLSEYGSFQTYDRGYFNDPQEVETLAGPVTTILIAHSFGLHWIEKDLLAQADLLLIISGFLHFHPYAPQYRRRSRMVLQEMINTLEVNPEEVLTNFFEDAYASQSPPEQTIGDINHQLLLDDLRRLQNAELDARLLKKANKVCIIHGSEDHVVSHKKGRQIYTQLPGKAQYFEIKRAGHALPFTHHKQCLDFVTPEILELVEMNF